MPLNKLKYQPSNPNYNSESVSQTWPSLIEKGKGGLPLKDNSPLKRYAQAVADISGSYYIRYKSAQVNAYILKTNQPAQAQARIRYFKGVATDTASPAANLIINKPSNVAENDILIAWLTGVTSSVITSVPSGWTNFAYADEYDCAVYYKIAGASEPSSYTWDFPSTYAAGTLIVYQGLDLVDPFYAYSATQGSGSTHSFSGPVLNTNLETGVELALFFSMPRGGGLAGPPADWTHYEVDGGGGIGGTTSNVAIRFLTTGLFPQGSFTSLPSDGRHTLSVILHPAEITKPMARTGFTSGATTTSGTSLVVNRPSQSKSGDTLIALAYVEATGASFSSTGWTEIAQGSITLGSYAVFTRRIHDINTEQANYTFTSSSATYKYVMIIDGRDINSNSNPSITYAAQYYTYASSDQWLVPSLTMGARSALLTILAANSRGDNAGPDAPIGYPAPYRNLWVSSITESIGSTSGFWGSVGAGYSDVANPTGPILDPTEASISNIAVHVAFMEYIVPTTVVGQSAARITGVEEGYAQAWALIDSPIKVLWAQSAARITAIRYDYAQAQVNIKTTYTTYAQALGTILNSPRFIASTATAQTTAGTSLVTPVPTNQDGDLLIAFWGAASGGSPNPLETPATGWKLVSKFTDANGRAYIYARLASSEPSDYTWNSGNGEYTITIHSYRPTNGQTWSSVGEAFLSMQFAFDSGVLDVVIPAITFPYAIDATLIAFATIGRGSTTTTAPTGYTMAGNPDSGGTGTSANESAVAYRYVAPGFAEATFFNTTNAADNVGFHVALVNPGNTTRIMRSFMRPNELESGSIGVSSLDTYFPIIVPNDLLVLLVDVNTATALNSISGWNLLTSDNIGGSGDTGYIFTRIADGTEGSVVTVSISSGTMDITTGIIVIANAKSIATYNSADDSSSNTSWNFPELVTTAQNPNAVEFAWYVASTGTNLLANRTDPSGYAFMWYTRNGNAASNTSHALAYALRTTANPGAGYFTALGSNTGIGFHFSTALPTEQYAQSNAYIIALVTEFGQAQSYIQAINNEHAQAEAYIDSPITRISVYAQALAFIGLIVSQSGQVNASILTTYFVSAQSIANIKQTYQQYNQSQGQILQTYNVVAQAQTDILQTYNVFAQAQAQILVTYNAFAQAETFIFYIQQVWAQANADILSSIYTRNSQAQANADILATYTQVSQAQGTVLQTYNQFAQAQTSILQTYFVVSQAQAHVVVRIFVFSQAQASILAQNNSFANAGTTILATYNAWAQGQATVLQTYNSYAQVQAFIIYQIQVYGQAEGFILLVFSQSAQVQGTVLQTYNQGAQVNVLIDSPYHYEYAQANASIAALIFKDTYTRVQSAGDLGTPDIGPDYGDATGEYTYTTADGSVGITASTVDYDGTYATVPIPHKNILTSIDFKVGYTPWATYAQINVRRNDAGTARVDAYIYDDDGVNGTHRLRIADWRSTPTSYDLILSNNTWYTLKFLTIANNAYAKVWERGTPEPDWQTSKTIPEDSGTNYFAFYQDCGETPHTQQQFDNFLAFEVYTPTARMFAQAKTRILRTNINAFAQAKTWIIPTTVVAQAKAQMLAFNINKFGLARPRIKVVNNNKVSQAQARMILGRFRNYSQALALIVVRDIEKVAQANTLIDSPIKVQSGNASVWIRNTYNSFAQALAMRAERYSGSGHTQAKIKSYPRSHANTCAIIKQQYNKWASVQSVITRLTVHQYAQATVLILRSNFAQTQAKIITFDNNMIAQTNASIVSPFKTAQAQGFIGRILKKTGLARAKITSNLNISVRANVRAHILKLDTSVFAQVQANIDSTGRQQWAQAGAKIETTRVHGQANAHVKKLLNLKQAQTIATIKFTTQGYAQSKAMIKSPLQSGNSQAYIHTQSVQFAQALTQIGSFKYGQAQSYIYSPVYLVKYNNHVLPGYAQHEALISSARIIDHYASPANGSLSEYIGLENKIISLRMRVVSEDYRGAKGQISRAGTILRSSHTWEKLYIHNSDRHYLALGKTVKMENTADKSGKVVDYDIEWHAKPWVISDQTYTVTGTGTVAVNRTLANGGWTPTTINITGTNVTVSGYTEYGEFAGFISVSGYVANLIVTSEPFGATINGVNSIARIKNPDYAMYIGPGTTYIVTTGATNCIITYNDRWSL